MVQVSVLICTYNRHEMLRCALTALLDRTTDKPDEVIIVNGGGDQANAVIAEFSAPISLQVIQIANKNLANSRNVGLQHCTGDIVAMTDDDAEVFPDWIARMKAVHAEHPEAGAVGGCVLGASSGESFLSRLADVVTFRRYEQPQYVRTLPGVNISYKRNVLDQIGPQDETLFRGEDVDFNWRVQRFGYKIYYDPEIKVLHHHRPTLKQFFYQHYMYGRAYYLVRKKWPEMYCVYPHHLVSTRDYLKAINFGAAAFYEPLLATRRIAPLLEKVRAVPVLTINQIVWRWGMIYQHWLSRENSA